MTISLVILFFYTISAIGNYIRSNIVIGMGMKIERKINERLFKAAFQQKLIDNDNNPASYQDDITVVSNGLLEMVCSHFLIFHGYQYIYLLCFFYTLYLDYLRDL